MEENICECGSTAFLQDTETGELVCKHCGLVAFEEISFEPTPKGIYLPGGGTERKQHGSYSTGTVAGGLSTLVGHYVDLADLSQKERHQFFRLRRWQRRTQDNDGTDRNLKVALGYMQAISSDLTIPRHAQELAAKIYRKALNAQLVRGRTIIHVSAAALYFACRRRGVSRTIVDFATSKPLSNEENTFRECELHIARDYRMLLRDLKLRVPVPSAMPLIAQICSQLGLPSSVEEAAAELLREYKEKKFSGGKSPSGLAAAAVYIACNDIGVDITQKQLADAAQVTEVTIRNRYKGIITDLKREETLDAVC